MIYVVIFAFLFILSLIEIINIKIRFQYILFLFLAILAGIRVDTGRDYITYIQLWGYVTELNIDSFFISGMEVGFIILTKFIRWLSDSEIIYLMSKSILTLHLLYIAIKKLKVKYVILSLCIYFMVFYIPYVYNAIRQGIVMSIFLFSISYMLRSNIRAVILLTTMATLIHSSGILILLSYLSVLYRRSIYLYMILGFSIAITFYLSGLSSYILFEVFNIKREIYIELLGRETSYFQLITRLILLGVFLYFYTKVSDDWKSVFRIYFLGMFIYISLFDYNVLATRFNMLFRVLEIIMVPIVIYYSKQFKVKLLTLGVFFIPFLYSFYQVISEDDNIFKVNPIFDFHYIF